jgi:shikimate kinase
MKHILIVGPSGSGKTTLCRSLAENDPHFVHLWLDEEVKHLAGVEDHADILKRQNGRQLLWDYFKTALDRLNQPNTDLRIGLVDVGSGVLRTAAGRAYLTERAANLLYIVCSPTQLALRVNQKLAEHGQAGIKKQILHETRPQDLMRVQAAARFIIDTSEASAESCINQLKNAALTLAEQANQS